MPDGSFLVFWSVPLLLVLLLCFAVLREHGTPVARRAAYLCLGIAALPGLVVAAVVVTIAAAFVTA